MAFKLQNIEITSFKIGFLFLIAIDRASYSAETFLNHLTHGKPSSSVVPAGFLQL
jgi:hypothetical protein